MDITPQDNTQPISDDQELAKALAGVLPEEPEEPKADDASEMQFEETPATPAAAVPPVAPVTMPTPDPAPVEPEAAEQPAIVVPDAPTLPNDESTGSAELDGIKLDALKELRPLMDKVELPAEEKFDTYLMLIRSTDDSSLIGPAHTAAQGIADEKRKAEALLEIIKEIDYLSRKDKPTA